MKYLLIFSSVVITLSTAMILDFAAEQGSGIDLMVVLLISAAFLLNAMKFGLWGILHKRYDVSKSFPVTSIFFPMIFLVACIQGEATPTTMKVAGLSLILGGLLIFENYEI